MGARCTGHIAELCAIVRPTVGVVTNVGLAHAEHPGGPDGIARVKGELLEALPTGGLAVLNADATTPGLAARTAARVLTAGPRPVPTSAIRRRSTTSCGPRSDSTPLGDRARRAARVPRRPPGPERRRRRSRRARPRRPARRRRRGPRRRRPPRLAHGARPAERRDRGRQRRLQREPDVDARRPRLVCRARWRPASGSRCWGTWRARRDRARGARPGRRAGRPAGVGVLVAVGDGDRRARRGRGRAGASRRTTGRHRTPRSTRVAVRSATPGDAVLVKASRARRPRARRRRAAPAAERTQRDRPPDRRSRSRSSSRHRDAVAHPDPARPRHRPADPRGGPGRAPARPRPARRRWAASRSSSAAFVGYLVAHLRTGRQVRRTGITVLVPDPRARRSSAGSTTTWASGGAGTSG